MQSNKQFRTTIFNVQNEIEVGKEKCAKRKKFKIELVPTFYTLQATATGSIYNLQSKYRKEEKRLEISVT